MRSSPLFLLVVLAGSQLQAPLRAQSYFWDFEAPSGLSGWRISTGQLLQTGPGLVAGVSAIVPTAFGAGDSTVFLYHAVPYDPSNYYMATHWSRSNGAVLPGRSMRFAWVDTLAQQYNVTGLSQSNSWSSSNWTYLELGPAQAFVGSGIFCLVIQFDAVTAQSNWVDNVSVESISASSVVLTAWAWLGGCYNSGSMSESLRSAGLLPSSEPYTALGYPQIAGGGGEWCAPALFSSAVGQRAVDWVRIELRSSANPATIVATRQAILDQMGVIRGFNGQTRLSFSVPPGNYYVAVRHRNHLGCMTASPVLLGIVLTSGVDFRSPSYVMWGSDARRVQGSAALLWPGDVNADGVIKYTGLNNDRDVVLNAIGGVIPTNVVLNVYDLRDASMNGAITYTGGSSNDRDKILQSIGGVVPTAMRVQQLP